MDHVDLRALGNGVALPFLILNLFAIDEDRHVSAQLPLVIEDVAAQGRVAAEDFFECFKQGGAGDGHLRAGMVSLDGAGEANGGQWGKVSSSAQGAGNPMAVALPSLASCPQNTGGAQVEVDQTRVLF